MKLGDLLPISKGPEKIIARKKLLAESLKKTLSLRSRCSLSGEVIRKEQISKGKSECVDYFIMQV